ncbi:MAG TPA: flagellar hook-length control protein FliK [Devosia sp.]|uniref:flagellar hook-length control protein FliK n=1 Tax=Devosia sp. TaxID=1871048 RepID=UPI002F939CCD
MASPLTVITGTAGASTSKTFGPSVKDGGEDVFAALLGATETREPEPQPEAPQASARPRPANDEVEMSTGFEPEEERDLAEADAVAVPVDAPVTLVPAETAKPKLTQLVEGLAALKDKLAAGEPLDPAAIEELDALLSDLAQALGIDLGDMPTADELAALAKGSASNDGSLAAKLVNAFGPLVGEIDAPADASEAFAAQIKSVGDKLAALLSALNNGEADPDLLAEMQKNISGDASLQAALDAAAKPAIAADAAPVLAKPELKLTEAAITGKTEAVPATELELEPATDSKPAEDAPKAEAAKPVDKDARPDADQDKGKNADKPAAGIAATTTDQQPETAATTQPLPAARAEVVAAPRVVQAGYQTSQQQLNLPQIAFELARQVNDGNTRFQIRLDPAELGRIDVRLDIDAAGQVNARLTVEKAETLDLMQRDQRALERALQQAGLDGSKTNLEFSLKQNPFGGNGQNQQGNERNPLFGDFAEAEEVPLPTVNLYRGSLSASGVNIIA